MYWMIVGFGELEGCENISVVQKETVFAGLLFALFNLAGFQPIFEN